MDKLTWFKFTPSDWMMGKIQRCSAETRGMFINLCCLYWNKECVLSAEDAEIEVDEDHFKVLVNKKIITIKGENISISFLDEQMEEILETSDKRRDAAKKRWEKHNAKAMQVNASALQNDADKSKSKSKSKKREELEKKRKDEILLCSISDETELDNDYQKTALAFWNLFKSNLIESGISKTSTLDKAKLKSWENDVRLMIEKDGRNRDEFVLLFKFLKEDEFWGKNIQSIKKLREQFEKIYVKASKQNNYGSKKSTSQSNFEAIRNWGVDS